MTRLRSGQRIPVECDVRQSTVHLFERLAFMAPRESR
jgi:hypothetical protein